MSTIEKINEEIRQMGYLPFIPKTEKPNYYRLEDGTILRLYPVLNNVIPNPVQVSAFQFNIQNNIATFVPRQLRGNPPGISYTPQQLQDNIDVYDMNFRAIVEDFNIYEVDSKQILSIKTTLAQVGRSKLRNNLGEPIYNVATSMIAKAKPKGIT